MMGSAPLKPLLFDPQLKAEKDYWIARLTDWQTQGAFRPDNEADAGAETATLEYSIASDLYDKLSQVTNDAPLLVYAALVGALKVCMFRYSGVGRVVVGSPALRTSEGPQPPANALAIVDNVTGGTTFRHLLLDVRQSLVEAYARQRYPYDRLVRDLGIAGQDDRCPLFNVAAALDELHGPLGSTAPDLSFQFAREERSLGVRACFRAGRFAPATVDRIFGHMLEVLCDGLDHPDRAIACLSLLTAKERQTIASTNRTAASWSTERCLHELVEAAARRFPTAVAVRFPTEQTGFRSGPQITYGELDRRADALAAHLQELGVGPEVCVAHYISPSIEMIVAVLAVLKAGGAYVPIDPAYPRERAAFMLDDCRAAAVLTDGELAGKLPPGTARVVRVDEQLGPTPAGPATGKARADNLAYVIYTSGTTGRPKGVLVQHRGAVNLVEAATRLFGVSRESRVLQQASLSFDASVLEIFLALAAGATLVVVDRRVLLSPLLLGRLLREQKVTAIAATPSLLELLPREQFPDLAALSIGGEPCTAESVNFWSAGRCALNVYAPTEATVFSTAHECRGPYLAPPPIGLPIANAEIHVLDAELAPVPTGVAGEVYIGGVGVTRGYLGLPALTAERFVPDPFSGRVGARLYRTGDLARRDTTGALEFAGRVDDQVKLRGFRIELGEIDATLARHPLVGDAVTMLFEDKPGNKRLVSYVVAGDSSDETPLEKAELDAAHLAHWQILYDETYANAQSADPRFDISGWNSSYTGQPLAGHDMREWLDDTVGQISIVAPFARVLDIGCGSGLVLFRLAPRCEEYVATDFSPIAVERLERELRRPGRELNNVSVLHRMADDFGGILRRSFDVVILNSVVQYFPSVDYLIRTLGGALEATRAGGVIFLGDVRSRPLLEALHSSVQFHKAPAALRADELRSRIAAAVQREEELVLDPAFFHALAAQFDRISHVEILLKHGRHHNELNRFRYQVMLHVESERAAAAAAAAAARNWRSAGLSLACLESELSDARPDCLALADVPNARLSLERHLRGLLLSREKSCIVGELRTSLTAVERDGVDPQDLVDLGKRLGYDVRLGWCDHDADGAFDVVFWRHQLGAPPLLLPYFRPPAARGGAAADYANDPARAQASYGLPAQLRSFLQEKLPAAMVPSEFIELSALPRTPHGKVDRRALPRPGKDRRGLGSEYVAPVSSTQRAIVEIWKEVLGIEQIGIRDNFFDLGGHSLLMVRVHSMLREQFGAAVALVDLFSHPTIEALARHIHQEPRVETRSEPPHQPAVRSGDIAVIGMACRFPGARNLEQFWELLRDGREAIKCFSDAELEASGIGPEVYANSAYVRAGGVIDGIDLFDANFFGYSAREAQMMDPQQRIFLEGAWELLERAGYDSERSPGKIAVFAGLGMNTYFLHNLLSNRPLLEQMGAFQTMLGNSADLLATRVSYQLNLKGPSVNVQTGCSTSLVAVHFACQSLQRHECDMALAGGVALLIPQEQGYLYAEGGVCSADGHCRPFDARATGTVPGRGMGIVALKRLADAIADADTIYAVVKGSAINNDGADKVGYTAPSVEGQRQAISAAIAAAEVHPETISFVEAHGTATVMGDPIEMAALNEAYRAHTAATQFCAIGSLKANIGHPDMASGIAGFIKAVLSIWHAQLPPSLHFEQPNPNIDFEHSPFYVNTTCLPWTASPRRAAVNALGIGGTNAHVILEEAPRREASGPSRPWQLLPLSAKTASALELTSRNIAGYLREHPEVPLADIAHTLRLGRRTFKHRRMIVCRDAADALAQLDGGGASSQHETRNRAVTFLFPGQGTQHVGMAKELYETEEVFRAALDRCAELARPLLNEDIRQLLYPGAAADAVAEARLQRTAFAQPALFAVEYALAQLWMAWGIAPSQAVGHSVGEFVAACIAEVLTLPDAVALVVARGRLMQSLPPGGMLALPLAEGETRALIGDRLSIAAVNAADQCIVSGETDALEALERALRERNVQSRRLAVSHAFHSYMVDRILPDFRRAVQAVKLAPPRRPFISGLTGRAITAAEAVDCEYWVQHLREPVRFHSALDTILTDPDAVLLEVGPGQTLTGLAKRHAKCVASHVACATLPRAGVAADSAREPIVALGRLWLAGLQPDFSAFAAGERRVRVPLPTYPFERKRYWLDVTGGVADSNTVARQAPGDLLVCDSWQQRDLAAHVPAMRRWLIVGAESGRGAALATRLTRDGHSTTLAEAHASFATVKPGHFALPITSCAEWRKLWGALEENFPQHIVYLADPETVSLEGLVTMASSLKEGCRQANMPELIVVGSGLEAVISDEIVHPAAAALAGAAAIHPGRHRIIDLGNRARIGKGQWALDQLVAELTDDADHARVAFRGRQRWVAEDRVAPVPAALANDGTGGTVLLIGDLSGPAWWFARSRCTQVPSRLVLVSEQSFPPPAETDAAPERPDAPVARALARIRDLTRLGCEVTVRNDLPDEHLDRTLAEAEPLAGVVVTVAPPAEINDAIGCCTYIAGALARMEAIADAIGDRQIGYCLWQIALPRRDDGLTCAAGLGVAAAMERVVQLRGQSSDVPWTAVTFLDWHDTEEDGPLLLAAAGEQVRGVAEIDEIYRRALAPHGVAAMRVITSAAQAEPAPVPAGEAAPPLHERPDGFPAYAAPRTALEQKVATLWSEYLGFAKIGIEDNFFDLGGHSLLASQIAARLREDLGVQLSVRTLFENATIRTLVEKLDSVGPAAGEAPSLIPRAPRDQRLPLSFAQQRMWFFEQIEPGSAAYTVPGCLRLQTDVNIAALGGALNAIVRRHEILRTTFEVVDGQTVQVIAANLELPLPVVDLTMLPAAEREARMREIVLAETRRPFRLDVGPLLRATLICCGPKDYVLQISMHHIVSDGWSLGVFIHELGVLYDALCAGRPSSLLDLPVQYADFACWQRNWLVGDTLNVQLDYWKKQLANLPAPSDLPVAKPRPAVQTYEGATNSFVIPNAAESGLPALLRLAQTEGATPFMALLGVYAALLGRYARIDDVVIGSPIANRNRTELSGLIGYFANTLALRVDLSGNPSFRHLLQRVRECALGAYAHQDLPFEKLVEELRVERDLSRSPLFQTMLILQNAPLAAADLEGLKITGVEIDKGTAQFDLTWYFSEIDSGLACTLEYNTDLFTAATIEQLVGHFRSLLAELAAAPDLPLSRHRMLAEQELHRIAAWSASEHVVVDNDIAVHARIEAQAARTPDTVAITNAEASWSYRDLDRRANQLARRLRSCGVGPETRVAVCLRRSPELVAALLGVLKAQGAFVPIDRDYPLDRTNLILDDARVSVVLTDTGFGARLRTDATIIDLDGERAHLNEQPGEALALAVHPRQLAYCLYTSGSTGRPKGVAIEHRSLAALMSWADLAFDRKTLSAVLCSTSICFDVALFEMFAPLCVGGRLVLVENILALATLPQSTQVSLISGVPSAVAEVVRAGRIPYSVAAVNLAGEALPVSLVNDLYRLPHIQAVRNLYGPTEDTVYSTAALLSVGENHIGRPIAGTRVHVLDRELQPVPPGVPGELYLAGKGLARGYLDRPGITADQFVPDPFGSPGARLYHTGDVVRFRDEGSLEFIGRVDYQVKIRGVRIELGEIEAALAAERDIQEAAVVARAAANDDRELVAFIVPSHRGARADDAEDRVEYWRAVWDDAFTASAHAADAVGWTSAVTGKPFSSEEMREFFSEAGTRMRSLPHQSVLELGCGNGLVFDQFAGTCRRYVGTDISEQALVQFRRRADGRRADCEIELRRMPAHSIGQIEAEPFDLVIAHSVAQYWPDVDYLLEVIAGALKLLKPDGHLFLGDLRSRALQPALYASTELAHASDQLTVVEFARRRDLRALREEELCIDPQLFVELQARTKGIAAVQIQLKPGRARNELTKFRYDVVLRAGTDKSAPSPVEWLDGIGHQLGIQNIESLLRERSGAVGLRDLADARLAGERDLLARVADPRLATVGELRACLDGNASPGIDPADLWELGRRFDRAVEIRPGRDPGYFDVLFAAPASGPERHAFPSSPVAGRALATYANTPAHAAAMGEAASRLQQSLAQRLPSQFVPAKFVSLAALPRTPSGKLDRPALARLASGSEMQSAVWLAPSTSTEAALASLWRELLGVERVGVNDNFFDLGGHSLLIARLQHRLQREFNLALPLRRFFEAPTLGRFAALIDHARLHKDTAEPDVRPDFTAEARLDPTIRPMAACAPAREPPEQILLTGATGFVGVFLLDELLRQTNATVHCLLRGSDPQAAEQRLHTALLRRGLAAPQSDRVEVVIGDLSRPRFGLGQSLFDRLSENLDAIVHCGASVNFIYPYEALRPTNVDGTREILRLAVRSRLKTVHYVSTVGVFGGRGAGNYLEDDGLADGVHAQGAYSQSKWVAERLIAQARERGVPAAIFRLGTVTGHSKSGICNESDFLWRLIRSCIEMGLAPDTNFTQDMTPVDYVARAVVHLAGGAAAANRNFHLIGRDRFHWLQLVGWLGECGYPLQVVPATAWIDAMREHADGNGSNGFAPLMPLLSTMLDHIEKDDPDSGRRAVGQMEFDCRNTEMALAGTSITCPSLDIALVRTYLDCFADSNLLPARRRDLFSVAPEQVSLSETQAR